MTEYLAENARLRQLSRRHAEGQLSLAEYRAERRAILEALEAGQTQAGAAPVVPGEPAAAPAGRGLPDDATVFLKTMPPQVSSSAPAAASPGEPAGWDSHTRILALVLGVSLLLAVGALVYVFAL